ncbi:hypothetical protein KEM55_005775, partial [Ascosphaera atra]
ARNERESDMAGAELTHKAPGSGKIGAASGFEADEGQEGSDDEERDEENADNEDGDSGDENNGANDEVIDLENDGANF